MSSMTVLIFTSIYLKSLAKKVNAIVLTGVLYISFVFNRGRLLPAIGFDPIIVHFKKLESHDPCFFRSQVKRDLVLSN